MANAAFLLRRTSIVYAGAPIELVLRSADGSGTADSRERLMDKSEARGQMERLLSNLRTFRSELETAERDGLEFVAERARHEIRKLHELIRRHCDWHNLARPAEVPEKD